VSKQTNPLTPIAWPDDAIPVYSIVEVEEPVNVYDSSIGGFRTADRGVVVNVHENRNGVITRYSVVFAGGLAPRSCQPHDLRVIATPCFADDRLSPATVDKLLHAGEMTVVMHDNDSMLGQAVARVDLRKAVAQVQSEANA